MIEKRRLLGTIWLVVTLAAFAVNRFIRYSDSALAHSGSLEFLDKCLTAMVAPVSLALLVYHNVATWRKNPRMWWRRCRRTCRTFGLCFAVIPTAMLGYKGRWDDVAICLAIAGAALLVALAAHVRLRNWARE